MCVRTQEHIDIIPLGDRSPVPVAERTVSHDGQDESLLGRGIAIHIPVHILDAGLQRTRSRATRLLDVPRRVRGLEHRPRAVVLETTVLRDPGIGRGCRRRRGQRDDVERHPQLRATWHRIVEPRHTLVHHVPGQRIRARRDRCGHQHGVKAVQPAERHLPVHRGTVIVLRRLRDRLPLRVDPVVPQPHGRPLGSVRPGQRPAVAHGDRQVVRLPRLQRRRSRLGPLEPLDIVLDQVRTHALPDRPAEARQLGVQVIPGTARALWRKVPMAGEVGRHGIQESRFHQRVDVGPRCLPRPQRLQRRDRRVRRRHAVRIVSVRADHRDPRAARVIAVDVPADRIRAAIASLVDIAVPVYQVIVADIPPLEDHGVIVVDGAHPLGSLLFRIVVGRHRVVHDDLL